MKQQSSGKGFAVLSTASVVCKILSLIYLPLQTWVVGDSGNGIIGIGMRLYTFIYALTNAGLPLVISKFVSEQLAVGDYRSAHKTFRSAFIVMMSIGVLSTVLMFSCADWIAVAYCHTPQAALMLRTISPTFLFTAVSCSLRGYSQGRHDMTPTAISQVIEQAFNTVFTVSFIVLFSEYARHLHADGQSYAAAGSAVGTVMGAVSSAVVLGFLFLVVHRREYEEEIRHQTYDGPVIATSTIYRQIIRYSIPAIISTIASSGIDLIDTNSVVWMLGAGGYSQTAATALFGIYTYKYQRVMTLATMFVAPMVTAMIPALSSALARDDHKYFRYKILESYKLIFITIMPIVAGLMFLAKPILTVIFIHHNAGSSLVLAGTWIAVLVAIQTIQSGILMSMGHTLVSPVTTIIGIAAKVLCNYLLIRVPSVNIYGAVLGNALVWVIAIVLNAVYIHRAVGHRLPYMRYLIVPGAVSLVMGVVARGVYEVFDRGIGLVLHRGAVAVNDFSTVVAVAVGALVYVTMMIKTGAVRASDIDKMPMGGKLRRYLSRLRFLHKELAVPADKSPEA